MIRFLSLGRLHGLGPAIAAGFFILAGCSKPPAAESSGPTRIVFQTDWYAQAEHGGYYQAIAKGFFKDRNLGVTVDQGGPADFLIQKLINGQVQLAMSRSDDVMYAASQGLPILVVCALMEHDPLAIMLHADHPAQSLKDLDGKSVMTTPGTPMVKYLEAHYGIHLNIIPLNYGLGQFMSDKNFIQQCFVTNEPYYVEKNGIKVKTFMVASSGYDPYRVIITTKKFAREHPEAVRSFVAASIKGWDDFINGDPTPGAKLILAANDKMTSEFIGYSIAAMKKNHLVSGYPERGEQIGLLSRKRLQRQMDDLVSLKAIPEPIPLDKFVDFSFLPPELQAKVDAP